MAQKKKEEPSFEQNLGRLEEIADILESGSEALEASLELFEEGVALIKRCNSLLDNADKKIKILTEEEKSNKEN